MTETLTAPAITTKPPTPNLNKALSQLQGKMTRVKKTKEGEIKGVDKYGNPFSYKYQYADLGDVVADLGPFMAEFGLAFTAFPTLDPANRALMVLQYALVHESGEERAGEWPLGPANQKAQSLGSALTYGRRYSFQAVTNIVLEDDDDGKHATDTHAETWDNAKPRGQGNGQRRRQQDDSPQGDKVAQGLAQAVFQVACNPAKTLDDLVKFEKQIAARDKLDAPVTNPFGGEGLAKLRDVLREARKRMDGRAGGEQGNGEAHGGGGESAASEADRPAQAGADDGKAFAELDAELRSTPLEDLQAFRGKIGRAVADRKITPEEGSALSADLIKLKRDLEDAAQASAEAGEPVTV